MSCTKDDKAFKDFNEKLREAYKKQKNKGKDKPSPKEKSKG